ncbi:MAG: hypothetical protein GX175_07730 [Halanaerobiaceae bacterium]|nr:hypothetical protein [Halanaerobiaceae bacterium]
MVAIFLEGLKVTILGMLVVLLGLYGLVLVLKLFEKIFVDDKKTETVQPQIIRKPERIQESDELNDIVAAISAVVSELSDNKEAVVNIRQLN